MNVDASSPLDENDAETPEEASANEGDVPQADGAEAASGETQQRRRELRESEVSGSVSVNGKSFTLSDWSSSGFGVSDCKEEFDENARVSIDFSITLESGPLTFSCKAIIVRSDPESGNMAGAFVEMRREDRVSVANYFDALEGDGAGEA